MMDNVDYDDQKLDEEIQKGRAATSTSITTIKESFNEDIPESEK